jgi:hypothetical protein
MRRLGHIVRKGELYGVVIALGDPNWDAVRVEWSDGTREWLSATDVDWMEGSANG